VLITFFINLFLTRRKKQGRKIIKLLAVTHRDLPLAVNRPVGCKKNRRHKKKSRGLSGSRGQDVTDRGEAMKKRK
jgi:hypothetical protein